MYEPVVFRAFAREVICVANLFNFILSVIAGIYSYYICKWLDGRK